MKLSKTINGKVITVESDNLTRNVWERQGFEVVADTEPKPEPKKAAKTK